MHVCQQPLGRRLPPMRAHAQCVPFEDCALRLPPKKQTQGPETTMKRSPDAPADPADLQYNTGSNPEEVLRTAAWKGNEVYTGGPDKCGPGTWEGKGECPSTCNALPCCCVQVCRPACCGPNETNPVVRRWPIVTRPLFCSPPTPDQPRVPSYSPCSLRMPNDDQSRDPRDQPSQSLGDVLGHMVRTWRCCWLDVLALPV